MTKTGELETDDMIFDEDGNFEIQLNLSSTEKNWLPMESSTNLLVVRQTFLDKEKEVPAIINIKCLDGKEKTL